MDEELARAIVDDVRRFADALFLRLQQLEKQVSADELKTWQSRVGRALGPLDELLLSPIESLHPAVLPKSMGGTGPDRALERPK